MQNLNIFCINFFDEIFETFWTKISLTKKTTYSWLFNNVIQHQSQIFKLDNFSLIFQKIFKKKNSYLKPLK